MSDGITHIGPFSALAYMLLFACMLIGVVAYIRACRRYFLSTRRGRTSQERWIVTLTGRIFLAICAVLPIVGLGLEIWAAQAHSARGVAMGHVLIQSSLIIMLTGALVAVIIFAVSMARQH